MQIVRIKSLDIFLNFGYNSFLHLSLAKRLFPNAARFYCFSLCWEYNFVEISVHAVFRNVSIFLYVQKYKYIQGLVPCSNKSKAYTPTAMFPSFFIELHFALH